MPTDNLGETVQLVIWGVAESAITIIAASIPILRALLRDDKMSNAPQSEAEIELNTGSWNMGSLSNSNMGNNLNVNNVNGSSSSNNNTGTLGRIRAAVTSTKKPSKTRAAADTTTSTTTTSSTRGAPSWVTAPVTVSSVNRDRIEDSRPLSTEIATGSKSLV